MQNFLIGLGVGLFVGILGGVIGIVVYLQNAGNRLASEILKEQAAVDEASQEKQNTIAIEYKETETRVRKAQTADEVNNELEKLR